MKVRITHAPPSVEPKSWEFDPDDADNLEAELIEVVGGDAWDSYLQWLNLMGRGNMRATRALLWILQRRTDPDLDFNEIRFRTSEIATEAIDDEEGPGGKEENGDFDTDSPPPTTVSEVS